MFSKNFAMTCLAAALALTPASRVVADIGDGLVGGLVGGVVGGLIVNEGVKNREKKRAHTVTTTTTTTPRYSAARAQTYETQVALNYFGFPAGVADGVRGRNTRNAVSQYQVHMGYPATGRLNQWERQFLITSFQRAQIGGAATAQLVAQRGQGTRGLLHAYRDEAAGVSAGAGVQDVAAVPAETTLLPNLMGGQATVRSLASHCNQISLLTNSNGGFVTQANMSDPKFVLSEQFCLARTYAIALGEDLARGLQGVTAAQLENQCAAFGPMLKPYVSALSLKPHNQVIQDVSSFVLSTGMTPAQLAGSAKICLSVGYRTDNLDVALGSALLLTVLGEQPYGELLGHHLTLGFGTSARADLALAWYKLGADAIVSGQPAVFAPGNPERTGLIQQAAYMLNGGSNQSGLTPPQGQVQPASALPSFSQD